MSCLEAPRWRLNSVFGISVPQRSMARPCRFVGFFVAAFLTSCGSEVKVATPAPPEFTAGISYTNYIVPEVPWSIHVVRVNRSSNDLELHSTHARGAALGLGTLSDQI